MNTIEKYGDSITFQKIIDRSIDEFIDNKIKNIRDYAFATCKLLKIVSLPSVTSIGAVAFSSCSELETLELPENVTVSASSFASCEKLTSFPNIANSNIPASCFSKTGILSLNSDKITGISQKAFYECTDLTEAILPNLVYNDTSAFENCTSLATVSFPSLKTISDREYFGCTSLQHLRFDSVVSIARYSFSSSGLVSIILPSITSFSTGCFSGCNSLSKIVIMKSDKIPSLNSNSLQNTPSSLIIYVPDALVEDYKAATNWSVHADKIKPLSELPAEE